MFKKILFTLVAGFLMFSLQVQNVEAAGLVPCGGTGEDPCTFCHLIVGIKGIIDWLTGSILIVAALFVITIAGVMWILGDSFGLVNQAKKAISGAVAGIVVVLTAWLMIIGLLNLLSARDLGSGVSAKLTKTGAWSFECSTESFIGGSVEGGSGGGGGVGSGYPSKEEELREDKARADLKKESNGLIDVWESRDGATNIRDLNDETREGVLRFQDDYGKKVLLTGGADEGKVHANHDDPTAESHANGHKVDINRTSALDNFLLKGNNPYLTDTGKVWKDKNGKVKAKIYKDPYDQTWAVEGSHYDVCLDCPKTNAKY